MARVFISHSSRDGAAARSIADWLLERGFETPFLDFDKHSGIPPGADWERTLYREIGASQALLIVQSANWNASKWCFAEFAQARALGKPIFQLVGVEPQGSQASDEYLAPITPDLQQLDLRQDRQAALDTLARQLSELALEDRGGFAWDSSRSPYPGLLCFEQEDAAIYFGRDAEIRELIERLQVLRIHGIGRLLVLLGSSGAGKSSLLRAGLLPRLARSGRHWLQLPPFRPGSKPCQALAQALALALDGARDWRQLDHLLDQAHAQGRLPQTLADLAVDLRLANKAQGAQVLIAVDQAEELFTEADPEQLRRFFTILSAALGECASFQVVMTLRSDFLGYLQAAEGLTVPLQELSLAPLAGVRIAEIIKGPAQVAGIELEEAFVQAAVQDARTDDALPLLAFALRELHDGYGKDRMFSLSDYRALGNAQEGLSPLENAVRRAADGVLELCRPSQLELEALRDAFVPALVRVNDQGDYTRRPAPWELLPPLAQPLLMRLVEARLLSVDQRGQERWVEVAHEALLRKWPLLRQWLDEAREFLVGSQQLERELGDWQRAQGPDKEAALLSGLKLSRAQSWLEERPQQFAADLRSFVEASIAQRDLAARRRRRQRNLVMAGLGLLAAAASAAWVFAQWANQQAYQAQTRQFLSVHLSKLKTDPLQSLVYGLAAMARLQGSPSEALGLAITLDRVASQNRLRGGFLSGQDEVWSLAETPGGLLISGGRDNSLRFWNAKYEPVGKAITTNHRGGVRGMVAITEDEWWTAGDEGNLQRWRQGRRQGAPVVSGHGSIQTLVRARDGSLISAGTDGNLRRWDPLMGTPLGPPMPSGQLEVWGLAVLPNGDWVSGDRSGTLQWWHQGKRSGAPIVSGQGAVTAVEGLANNGVVSGGDDGTAMGWNPAGIPLEAVNSGHSTIYTLLRRRNGIILSGGSEKLINKDKNYIRIWRANSRQTSNIIRSGQAEALSIVELCNGDFISGGSDGFLSYWRGGRRLGNPIKTGHGRVYALTQTLDGDLVSGGSDGKARIWRNGIAVKTFATDQREVTSLATLADGTLLSGGKDGSLKHWSAAGNSLGEPAIQTRHGSVWVISNLANGNYITGGDDGKLRIWRRGNQVGNTINTPHNSLVSIVIRKNGDWVTGGSGGKIQFWHNGKLFGDYIQTEFGSLWSLIERRDGELMSANGDGTIYVYPTAARAIAKACVQLTANQMINNFDSLAVAEARNLCAK